MSFNRISSNFEKLSLAAEGLKLNAPEASEVHILNAQFNLLVHRYIVFNVNKPGSTF